MVRIILILIIVVIIIYIKFYAIDDVVAIVDENNKENILEYIALTPTKDLTNSKIYKQNISKLSDADFMQIAVILARKSYNEGGCPIGGVIVDKLTNDIVGKGHNTLVQENDPYNHGETSALRDAGRIDFSTTTLYTTLSPCDICTALIYMRGFKRVIVGDITNASGNERILRNKNIEVLILENNDGINLYKKFRKENPQLELEDWRGLSAVNMSDRSD